MVRRLIASRIARTGVTISCALLIATLAVAADAPTKTEPTSKTPTTTKESGAKEAAKPAEKPAAKKKDEPQFLRVLRDAKDVPTSLDTAVVRYTATEGKYAGATVDLIGAVHVGDKSYYRKLNKLFAGYDSLLYELLAPKGTRIPKGGKGGSAHPVGMMQQGMTDVLGLAYQLEEVDYTKKNFVHADMSPDEFSDKMEERGESWMSMMFKMMGQGIAMQADNAGKGGGSPEMEMLFAIFDDNRELKLKRALAKQFENMETMMSAFEGEEGSTIITERNIAAFKVLAEELNDGKKKIGVFYGAGHLADMDERLIKEFGLKRESTEWLTAWQMSDPVKKPAKPAKPKPAKKQAAE
ncbi:MAG: TraB/GumN family protein [Planctomycetia bacterium]|nr:TraB/GumN family protein [Planctomycetia bacterium]